MPKQIFDQQRPRSTMAQRLDEAFAGCDEWTVIATPQRRSILKTHPIGAAPPRIIDAAKLLRADETASL